MTHKTDFLELYRRLGLDPGCGLDELKQAYRRKMAELHPDRHLGQPVDARAAARLQRITAQYSSAMDFHRRHGRLPGAPQSTASNASPALGGLGPVREAADPFAVRRDPLSRASAWSETSAPVARRPPTKLAALLVVVAIASLGWALYEASPSSSPDGGDDVAAVPSGGGNVSQDVDTQGAVLHVGMSADDVRVIEGEPLAVHGDLWEYGPSWVRFDHDDVVEWHSSPLRPLHTEIGPGGGLAH